MDCDVYTESTEALVSHRNAPLSETGRLRLARCVVEQEWPLRRAAERFQVAAGTAKRWADRYRDQGEAGMADRSSRPHASPGTTSPPITKRIVSLRLRKRWGPVRLAAETGVADDVVLTGSVPWEELPAHYNAGDVFAMPCRTRRGGLDVEGLGMVYLEAAACGRPVVAGTSGGAPETVQEGVTGHVVGDPRSPDAVAAVLTGLLDDPERARRMGAAGRAWVEQRWSWTTIAATFAALLTP